MHTGAKTNVLSSGSTTLKECVGSASRTAMSVQSVTTANSAKRRKTCTPRMANVSQSVQQIGKLIRSTRSASGVKRANN
jgi:hypothetical protein